jgi:hypothetical protein
VDRRFVVHDADIGSSRRDLSARCCRAARWRVC